MAERADPPGGHCWAPPRQTSAVVRALGQADRSARWSAFRASPWPAAQSPLLQTPASRWLRAPSSSLGGCSIRQRAYCRPLLLRYSSSLTSLQHVDATGSGSCPVVRPEGRIDYSQFGIDPDGKTLYWTPEDKKISIAATRGKFRFLGLGMLAQRYGAGGAYAVRRSLGLTDYRSGASRGLGREVVETLQSAEETLLKNIESIELKDLPGMADTTRQSTEDVETALKTINDPPMDTAWVTQAAREFAGVKGAMTRMRDELANNLVKLSDADDWKGKVEKHLARERRKLTETDDTEIQEEIRDRMKKLQGELSDIELERQARLETISTNQAALQSQVSRIRETIRRLLHEDKTLAKRIQTLFREQGIIIASILTAIGMAISTLMLVLTGGGSAPVPSPARKPSDKGGVKEWIKKHLQALGRALANLAGKAAAALPGIIGSIVSWLLSMLGKAATWLADNVRALVIGVGALLLVAARDWLSQRQPKRH